MRDTQGQILVFDVGGSHIAAGLFNPNSLELTHLRQAPAPANGDPEEVYEQFKSLKDGTLGPSASASGVAVAIPNPFDYDKGVSYMRHKYQLLYAADFRKALSQYLNCEPQRIHFLNDAAAFLIGELHRGAARGVSRVMGVTLGTGIGSAFAVEGEIALRGTGIPSGGEIWNLPYGDSIVEKFVSARAIQLSYQRRGGDQKEVREIAALGPEHASARETFESFGRELGKVLRHTCLEFDPQRIILGGGIARAGSLFKQATEEELNESSIQVWISELCDGAPLIGAGISWIRQHAPENALSHLTQNSAVMRSN